MNLLIDKYYISSYYYWKVNTCFRKNKNLKEILLQLNWTIWYLIWVNMYSLLECCYLFVYFFFNFQLIYVQFKLNVCLEPFKETERLISRNRSFSHCCMYSYISLWEPKAFVLAGAIFNGVLKEIWDCFGDISLC